MESFLASGTGWPMGCGWQSMEAGGLAAALPEVWADMMGAEPGTTATVVWAGVGFWV